MERDIPVKSTSAVGGLSSLSQTNGTIQLSINFDENLFNNGVEQLEIKDPRTSSVELLEQRKVVNSTEGIECELLISQNIDPIFEVDVDGHLYLSDIDEETQNYIINSMSELEFNFVI